MLHVARNIVALDGPLAVRVGVHRGRAYVGDVGTAWRRTWTVMGDATNTAARVMGKSPPGARARHDRGAGPHAPHLRPRSAGAVHRQGQAGTRCTRRIVGEPVGERTSTVVEDVPLIGRDAEFATLVAGLAEASAGRPAGGRARGRAGHRQEPTRAGDPGASPGIPGRDHRGRAVRGLQPVLRAASGRCATCWACPRTVRTTRPRPCCERPLPRETPDLQEWLPLLGIPLGLRLEATERTAALAPEFARARLHAATSRLLQVLLGPDPSLLLIEDAHWLDEASADLLAFLLRVLRNGPRMVVMTRRAGHARITLAGLPSSTVIELTPLDAGDARRLLVASLPDGRCPGPGGDGPAAGPRRRQPAVPDGAARRGACRR